MDPKTTVEVRLECLRLVMAAHGTCFHAKTVVEEAGQLFAFITGEAPAAKSPAAVSAERSSALPGALDLLLVPLHNFIVATFPGERLAGGESVVDTAIRLLGERHTDPATHPVDCPKAPPVEGGPGELFNAEGPMVEVWADNGQVFRVWRDGRTAGFPAGRKVLINRATTLANLEAAEQIRNGRKTAFGY